MKNTLENKAKFFSQYWGQLIVGHNDYTKNQLSTVYHYLKTLIKNDDGYFLELTPLSSITDEDAKTLGYFDAKSATTTYLNILGGDLKDADYLRSKGYALPYMGLSVEKQIEYGWIKLKVE